MNIYKSRFKIVKKFICVFLAFIFAMWSPYTVYAKDKNGHDDEEWEEEGGWNDDRQGAVWTSLRVTDWHIGTGWNWDQNSMIALSDQFLQDTEIDWNNKNKYITSIADIVHEELEELSDKKAKGKLAGKIVNNSKYDPLKYESFILLNTFYIYEYGIRGTNTAALNPIGNNYYTDEAKKTVGYENSNDLIYDTTDGKIHLYFPDGGDPETGQEIGNVYNGLCYYKDVDNNIIDNFYYHTACYDICFYNEFYYSPSDATSNSHRGVIMHSAKDSVYYLFEKIVMAEMNMSVRSMTKDEGTKIPDIYHSDEYLKRLLFHMLISGIDTSSFSERCSELGLDYTLDDIWYCYPLDNNLGSFFDSQSDQAEFESNIFKMLNYVNDDLPDIRPWRFVDCTPDDVAQNPSFSYGTITAWYTACSFDLTHGLFDASAGSKGGYGNSTGSSVVDYAKQFLGTKYVWGGASPDTGFDCSGFTMYVFDHFGVSLPHDADGQKAYGTEVTFSDLQPGDLIVIDWGGDGEGDHVAIYVGDSKYIHSSGGSTNTADNPGKGVEIKDFDAYTQQRVLAYRRLVESTNGVNPLNESDRDLLARLISGEGGSGDIANATFESGATIPSGYPGYLDQLFVGSVAMNRVASDAFPNTLMEVVYQSGQYACTWDGNQGFQNPTEQAYDVADYLIANGSQLPEDCIWQAAFSQGSSSYCIIANPGANTHYYDHK